MLVVFLLSLNIVKSKFNWNLNINDILFLKHLNVSAKLIYKNNKILDKYFDIDLKYYIYLYLYFIKKLITLTQWFIKRIIFNKWY